MRPDVDALGKNLEKLALLARSFPPAYAEARVREPIVANEGEVLGHVLDGVGIYLDCDLKDLGIVGRGARRLRKAGVFERTDYRRAFDFLGDEQGALASVDNLVGARGQGNYWDIQAFKFTQNVNADLWMSLYSFDGHPRAGTYANIPGGAAKNRTDAGALSLSLKNPASGSLYLTSLGVYSDQGIDQCMIVDLLVGAGNVLGTVSTLQTVNSAALTRYTTGVGVYMSFEVTNVFSSLPINLTVTYTNSSGTGSRTTTAALANASRFVLSLLPGGNFGPRMPIQASDAGIQSVQSAQMASADVSGIMALMLWKPVVFYPRVLQRTYSDQSASSLFKAITNLALLPQDSNPQIGCLVPFVKAGNAINVLGNSLFVLKTCWG